MKNMATKEKAAAGEMTTPETTYTKEQILASAKYARQRDALSVLLDEGKSYTQAAATKLADEFYRRSVK